MKNISLFLLAVLFTAFGAVAQNLQVTQIAGASALVTWDNDPTGNVSFYSLEYAEEGQNNGVFVSNITDASYMLSSLEPLTNYVVRLQANYNDNSVSEWSTISFITGCLAGGENAVGNGTSTSDFLPSHSLYQYGYSQQIFTAAEIGSAGNIYSLSIEMSDVSRPRRYKIYLMHTTATMVSTWLPADSAQLVFDAEQDLVEGWNTFHFSAPFAYNGTDNLVLIFVDNSNVIAAASFNRSIVHTAYSNCTYYIYNHNTPFDINTIPSSPGTSASVRNNVIFGGICDTTVTCIVPNIFIDHITQTTADVRWAPGYDESAWELEYALYGDSVWTSVTNLTGDVFTLNQLTPYTHYKVRMRAVCAPGQVSEWVMTDFTTECAKLSVPYFEDFNSINASYISGLFPGCWTRYDCFSTFHPFAGILNHGGAEGRSLNFYSTSSTFNMAVMPEAEIEVSLLEVSFYLRVDELINGMVVGVMTEADGFDGFIPVDTVFCTETNTFQHQVVDLDTYLGTGKYIAFKNCNNTSGQLYLDDVNVMLIPSCRYPNHIVVTDIYKDSAVIAWTERGSATEWILEYGPSGFTPGSGTTIQTTQNPYTLTGLYAETGYDVYMRSDCGEGDMSDWYPDHASFTTRSCSPAHQCEYYFVCVDRYGDGWNGAYVSIQQNELPIAIVRSTTYVTSEPSTMIDTIGVMLCDNVNTTIIWHAGTYDNEASLMVLTPAGDTLYTHTNMSTVGSDTLLNFIANCDGFISPVCDMPLYLTVDSVGGNSADVSWTAGYVETEWNLQYKEAVATSWSESIPLTSAHYQIPDLMAETEYQVRVQANCIDTLSDWTNPVSFITQSGGVDSVGVDHLLLAQSICLRPNPADKFIELIVNSHIEVKEALVFNAFGQLIQAVPLTENHARIDLSWMAAGIYFVRISNTGATKKFIKR
ncbi:MAG: fibronectin type III domain-containing protein [Bacteroidales bacterium]|nr:fibronectin type III domain-containing protein [Bacteroidales bacterium]